MHVAASQSIWCFICKWCSAMWLLTSPFLVAGLRSVSRVLRFLCRCRPSYWQEKLPSMCTLYWIAFPANMKSSTVQDGKQRQRTETSRSQRNKHRTSVGREGLVPNCKCLLSTGFSAGFNSSILLFYFCYGLNSCSHWAKSGRNLSDMWRFTI